LHDLLGIRKTGVGGVRFGQVQDGINAGDARAALIGEQARQAVWETGPSEIETKTWFDRL
jgi:hypothetical protein